MYTCHMVGFLMELTVVSHVLYTSVVSIWLRLTDALWVI